MHSPHLTGNDNDCGRYKTRSATHCDWRMIGMVAGSTVLPPAFLHSVRAERLGFELLERSAPKKGLRSSQYLAQLRCCEARQFPGTRSIPTRLPIFYPTARWGTFYCQPHPRRTQRSPQLERGWRFAQPDAGGQFRRPLPGAGMIRRLVSARNPSVHLAQSTQAPTNPTRPTPRLNQKPAPELSGSEFSGLPDS